MDKLRAIDPLGADWTLLILLVALGTLGWINLVSPKKWRLLVRSFFSYRLGRQTLRDELDLQDRTLIGLAIMACGTIALFLYQVAVLRGGLVAGFGPWSRLFGVCLGVQVAQVLVVRLVGLLVEADSGLSEYLFTLLLFHVALGIVLLPIAGVMAFPHVFSWRAWLPWAGGLLVAVVVGFRWVRAAVVGLGEGVPLRYIFIYLCALEILPAALAFQHVRQLVPTPSHTL